MHVDHILTVLITTKLANAQRLGVFKSNPPVSRGTSSAYLNKLFLHFGPSRQVTPFPLPTPYPPTSPSAMRPTFPFSVLGPSIFAKSRLP